MFRFLKDLVKGILNAFRRILGQPPILSDEEIIDMEAEAEAQRTEKKRQEEYNRRHDQILQLLKCARDLRYKRTPDFSAVTEFDELYLTALNFDQIWEFSNTTPERLIEYFDYGVIHGYPYKFPRPKDAFKKHRQIAADIIMSDRAKGGAGKSSVGGPKNKASAVTVADIEAMALLAEAAEALAAELEYPPAPQMKML